LLCWPAGERIEGDHLYVKIFVWPQNGECTFNLTSPGPQLSFNGIK
jgi:hypothetical protein